MKSRIQVPLEKTGIQHPESRINGMGPESKTVLYSLTWGDSTGLGTANYYFSFVYLPLIRSPHLKTFVNEISVRRFVPFTDCFFLLRVASFCFHAPRDSPESKVSFVSKPVNKEVGTRK